MKKEEITDTIKVDWIDTVPEYWLPSAELRWKRYNTKRILQQKWCSTIFREEWRDVPEEQEETK